MSSNNSAVNALSLEDKRKLSEFGESENIGDGDDCKMSASNGDVRIVTIAGKQVELKYETLRRNYDIYGLHAKQRRVATKGARNKEVKTIVPPIRANSIDDRNSVDTNGSNHSYEDSSASSQNSKQTNGESPKISKIMKKFESYERSLSKNSAMDRIAGSKMKKEPVKIENRFDMLSLGTEDDAIKLNGHQSNDSNDKEKKKKKRKKKSKPENATNCNDDNTNVGNKGQSAQPQPSSDQSSANDHRRQLK